MLKNMIVKKGDVMSQSVVHSGNAALAGCTRSLFYHYFPTKEDALQAVLDLSIDSFVEQLTAWNE